jgi:hydrogenase maturation protease
VSTVTRPPRVVVAGFGSQDRLDDGVGPLVAQLVARRSSLAKDVGPLADSLDLLDQWDGADLVVVVDALRSGTLCGTVRVLEMDMGLTGGDPGLDDAGFGVTSTHGIGLAGVVRLARAVDQCPKRLVIVGIEGEKFGFGQGLSPAVHDAVPKAVDCVLDLIQEIAACA